MNRLYIALLLLLPISACAQVRVNGQAGANGQTGVNISNHVHGNSLSVTPANQSAGVGFSVPYTAILNLSNGKQINVSNASTWSSSNSTIVSLGALSSTQMAKCVSAGTAQIQATYGNFSNAVTLTCTGTPPPPPTLVSIAVTPNTPTVPVGQTQGFTATGTYSDGTTQSLTAAATWGTSDATVASLGTLGPNKPAKCLKGGSANITATSGLITGTGHINCAAVLTSLAIAPNTSSILVGASQTFIATGTYSDGSQRDVTLQATWTSGTTSVASIGSAADPQPATGLSAGSSTITAAIGTISNTATLTVTNPGPPPPTLSTVTVNPGSPTINVGATLGFTATCTYSDSSTQDCTLAATWTSGTPATATLGPAANPRVATGVANGTTVITATVSAVPGTTTLTVQTPAPTLSSIAVTPTSPTQFIGSNVGFTATGTYSDGSTQNLTASAAWTSGTPSVATIGAASNPQTANCLTAGSSVITATFSAIPGTSTLTCQTSPSGVALPDNSLLTWNTTVANRPSPGSVVTICGSGCTFPALTQTVLNGLACGQTLEIDPAITTAVSGSLSFNKTCDAAHWLTYETRDLAGLTAEGTRATPCYIGMASSALAGLPSYTCVSPARHMPQILKTAAGATISVTCGFCNFVGIEFTRTNTYDLDFGIIDLSTNAACTGPNVACMNGAPTNVIFDRCIIHGDAQRQTVRGFLLGGTRWAGLLESYIYDVQVTYAGGAGDAQAWAWGLGKDYTNVGFGKMANNFVSASTEGILTGGGFVEPLSPSTGFDGIPHDYWLFQNWVAKNPLWDTQIGATLSETETIEGVGYGPANDQEITVQPAAVQLAVNQSFQFQLAILNDSRGGINRALGTGSTPTLTCGSANCGTITTVEEHTVGTGAFSSQNQVTYTYTAPNTVPTGSTVTLAFHFVTVDGRLATLGNNRTLTATATVTVVGSSPSHLVAVGPAASDLVLQPSYSDSNGNSRQFQMVFNAVPNFTSTAMTYKVDGVTGGNSTVGTITTQGTLGLYTAPVTISSGSPAFQAGTSSGAPSTDFDGIPRGLTPSIGAYQQ